LDLLPFFQLWRQPAAMHRLDGTNVTLLLMAQVAVLARVVALARVAAAVRLVDLPPLTAVHRHRTVAAVHPVATE
jgi:protein gp37